MCEACRNFREAIESPTKGALLSVNGALSWGGDDVAAVAATVPGDAVRGPSAIIVGGKYKARFAPVADLRAEARDLAAHEGVPVALATVIKTSDRGGDLVSVLKAEYLYEPHNPEALMESAEDLAPELLYHLSPVCKELDPLDPRAVDRIVANVSNYMSRKWGQVSAPVFDRWINDLINRHWGDATGAELELVTRQLNQSFREAGGKHWNAIRGQMYLRNERSANGVKAAMVRKWDFSISPNLALKDVQAIRQSTASMAHYVTDAHGNIAVQASQQARQIVKSGISQGLGNREIGRDLQKALGKTLTGRTAHYFDVAASAMVVRSQSYSKLITMQEAGVERTLFSAVLDEVTTPTCRWADGKVWNVELLLAQSARTAANTDPRDVRFTQPWIRERKIKGGDFDGKRGLFVRQRDGSDTMIAAELESGYGEIDNRGRWHEAMDQETLQDMGIGQPPLHGNCLLPNSRVITRDRGEVPVESLTYDDMVLTHRGRWKSVELLTWRWYTGGITTIRTDAGYVTLTDDHPVAVASGAFVPAGGLTNEPPLQLDQETMRHVRGGLRDAALPIRREVLLEGVSEQREVSGVSSGNQGQAEVAQWREGRQNVPRLREGVQNIQIQRLNRQGEVLLGRMQRNITEDCCVEFMPAMRQSSQADSRSSIKEEGDILFSELSQQVHQSRSSQAIYGGPTSWKEQSDVSTHTGASKRIIPASVQDLRPYATQEHVRGQTSDDFGGSRDGVHVRATEIRVERGRNVCTGLLPAGDRSVVGEQGQDKEETNAYHRGFRVYPWPNPLRPSEIVGSFRGDTEIKIIRGHVEGVRVYSIDVEDDRTFVTGGGILVHNCRSTLVPDMIQPKTRTRRVNVPAPRPRPPIIDPLGAKPRVPTSTANTGLAFYEGARVAQSKQAVDAGRMPRKKSKYDKVISSSNKSAVAPVFRTTTGLDVADARSLAARRIKQILLAAAVAAAARIREVRLSSKIKPKDALSKVDYKESTRVLTVSKEAAEDTTEGGKQVTGKQLAYALELERRRDKRKDGKATPADRAAARQADITNSTGILFDERALEEVP